MPTRFVSTRSGIRIAFEEYGDRSGAPVVCFHGWPASRLQGAGFDADARELGLRIIAADRPGIGLSSYEPGRRLLSWPPIVCELAQELGISRLSVLAVSGGGPYAFATGWALPNMVETMTVISGAPPLAHDVAKGELLAAYRCLLSAYRIAPRVLRILFCAARPFATFRPPPWMWPLFLQCVPQADREAMRDFSVLQGSFLCYLEAWRGSSLGVVTDAEVYANEWGFQLEEVRVPVTVWHGRVDRTFSWRLVKRYARKLPNCDLRIVDGEGHYSLPIRCRRRILENLAARAQLSQKTTGNRE